MELKLQGYIDSFARDTKGLLTTQIRIIDLLNYYILNKEVNRDVVKDRIPKIVKYIEGYDSNMGMFFPSVVLQAIGPEPGINELMNEFTFNKDTKLLVLDGQHRIKALERYVNKETDQKHIESILNSTITAQVYFNLQEDEQRKLFLDINSTMKKVSHSLLFKYDERDLVNVIIKELLNDNNIGLNNSLKITEQTRLVRPANKSWMTYPRFNRYISYLLFKTNKVSNSNLKIIEENYFEISEFLSQYFQLLIKVLPEEFGNVEKYTLGHEALQNALAIATHEKIIRVTETKIVFKSNWEDIIEVLHFFDWSVSNEAFKNQLIQGKSHKYFRDNKHGDILPIVKHKWDQLLYDWIE